MLYLKLNCLYGMVLTSDQFWYFPCNLLLVFPHINLTGNTDRTLLGFTPYQLIKSVHFNPFIEFPGKAPDTAKTKIHSHTNLHPLCNSCTFHSTVNSIKTSSTVNPVMLSLSLFLRIDFTCYFLCVCVLVETSTTRENVHRVVGYHRHTSSFLRKHSLYLFQHQVRFNEGELYYVCCIMFVNVVQCSQHARFPVFLEVEGVLCRKGTLADQFF